MKHEQYHPAPHEPFTPGEMSRLKAFEHIEQQIATYEPKVNAGESLAWGVANEQGQITTVHLDIDRPQIARLKRMAYELYESDFKDHPHLKDVAEDIVRAYQHFPEEEHQLSELWHKE